MFNDVYGRRNFSWFCLLIEVMIKRINLVNFFSQSVNFHEKYRILSSAISTSSACQNKRLRNANFERRKFPKEKEDDFADTFGNIDCMQHMFERIKDDSEDILEYQREKAALGKGTDQYIKEVKSHLDKHDYKSALKILEVDMVNDRKRLTPFIYKVLINYNAKIGNLEEAYRLFLNFKRRHGIVTGAMYTSMFNACANCDNSLLAIEKANAVTECMRNNKNHSINTSNYNVMLKAYGRHGDLLTCLKIVDEVLERRDKVQASTYNFLLQACISDKNSGFRHALIVWRKMLQNLIKPDIYSFYSLLKCVSECSLGDTLLIPSIIKDLKKDTGKFFKRKVITKTIDGEKTRIVKKIPASGSGLVTETEVCKLETLMKDHKDIITLQAIESNESSQLALDGNLEISHSHQEVSEIENNNVGNQMTNLELNKNEDISCEPTQICSSQEVSSENIEECKTEIGLSPSQSESESPNLIALKPTMGSVVEFGAMTQPYHRFILLGGVKGFLKTMAEFGVKPDLKVITLLLNVIPPNLEAEQELISIAQALKIKFDTIFFNVLMKKRFFRYEDSSVKECLEQMYSLNLQPDMMTFGILALGCRTYEEGMDLLNTLRNYGYRANTEILETLLKNAQLARDIKYVHAILQAAKEDETDLSQRFLIKLSSIVRKEKEFRKIDAENKLKELKETSASLPSS